MFKMFWNVFFTIISVYQIRIVNICISYHYCCFRIIIIMGLTGRPMYYFVFFDYRGNEMSPGTRTRLLAENALTYSGNVKRKTSSSETSTNCTYYYYIRTRAVIPIHREFRSTVLICSPEHYKFPPTGS